MHEPLDPQILMLRGLLPTDEQAALYRTSPSFKAAMDTLVSMLPLWVCGIAEQAVKTDRDMAERIEVMKRSVNTSWIIPPSADVEGWIPGPVSGDQEGTSG